MSAELVSRMLREIEHVEFLKEETAYAGQMMTAVEELAGASCQCMLGGAAGRFLMDEYRRGSYGTMPACEVVDLHVQLWELLERGDEAGARALYARLLPLLNLEGLYSFPIFKAVLHRRGVIDSPFSRAAGAPTLDRFDLQELDAIFADLEPLFRL